MAQLGQTCVQKEDKALCSAVCDAYSVAARLSAVGRMLICGVACLDEFQGAPPSCHCGDL